MTLVRILRACVAGGHPRAPGDCVEIDKGDVRMMVAYGDAEPVLNPDEVRIMAPEVGHRDPMVRRKR